MHMRRWRATLMWALLGGLVGAAPSAFGDEAADAVLGPWAREASLCKRPEFIFRSESATIQTDADGTEVAFLYRQVAYSTDGRTVTVALHRRHPYGKTPDKTALSFEIEPGGAALLKLVKGRTTRFVRCDRAAS